MNPTAPIDSLPVILEMTSPLGKSTLIQNVQPLELGNHSATTCLEVEIEGFFDITYQ